jgi:hypothetical protein
MTDIRLPEEKDDILERVAAWFLNRQEILKPLPNYQKQRYHNLLTTQAVVSYKHRQRSLCVNFQFGDRIHFRRALLRDVISIVDDSDSELVLRNTFFLEDLESKLPGEYAAIVKS